MGGGDIVILANHLTYRLPKQATLIMWSSIALIVLGLFPAAGSGDSGPCGASGAFTPPSTCTYSPTNVEDTFVVPAGVTSIHVVAKGASGGTGDNGGAGGGLGATVTADVSVTAETTVYVAVG